MKVTIKKTSIIFDGPSWATVHTAEDLGKALLYKLTKYIIDETFKDATSFGYKVKRDGFTLTFSHPHKLISITFVSNDRYSIDIVLSESVNGIRESKKMTWNNLPGDTIEDKLRYVFSSRRDTPLITHPISKNKKENGLNKSPDITIIQQDSPTNSNGIQPSPNNNPSYGAIHLDLNSEDNFSMDFTKSSSQITPEQQNGETEQHTKGKLKKATQKKTKRKRS